MTVNLTRIYTKLGDGGETHLGRHEPRLQAAPARGGLRHGRRAERRRSAWRCCSRVCPSASREWLRRVQNDLLDVGADLSVPRRPPSPTTADERARVCASTEPTPQWLEQACDEVNAELEPLRSFVIPGGSPAAAHLHVCRTVCRRAERRTIAVGSDGNPEVVRYLNRLSDLLFILARAVARSRVLWDPGAHGGDGSGQGTGS